MKKILLCIFTGIVASLYYFQVTFAFLPQVNTKNLLGAIGAALLAIRTLRNANSTIPRNIVSLVIFATLVSIAALFSVVYNQTNDMAYATYIVSFAIWMCGAYAVCSLIKLTHDHLSFELVSNYLIVVCVFQCAMAMLIEYVPAVQIFVDTWIMQGQDVIKKMDRLYGVGASLDTAGCRFSCVLVLIAGLLRNKSGIVDRWKQWLWLFAFAVILVIGNMMARTTLVGVALWLVYLIFTSDLWKMRLSSGSLGLLGKFLVIAAVAVPLTVFLYAHNPLFHDLIRFGFEGFFGIFEKGEWSVRSNDALETMVVFPDNLKTWIIGDGYFGNPNHDVNYLGDLSIEGFYMGTDIGYLRFIFYFGLVGLLLFIVYLICAARSCAAHFVEYKWVFMFVLLAGLIIWLKVATDVFLVFALFINAANMMRWENYDPLSHLDKAADDDFPTEDYKDTDDIAEMIRRFEKKGKK